VVLGVAAIARLRRALSDNVLLTASAAVYAVGLIATAYFPFRMAVVLLLLCGVSWIATLTTLNAAAQLSLAH
jgi:hypothetical protein